MNPKKILLSLFHSKWGKLLPVLLIAGLTASASAAVFVMYYGSASATVQSADVKLVAGPDSTSCTTTYPCATVTPSSTGDYATIAITFFPSVTQTSNPQPETYYTNLLQLQNTGGSAHTINSITISNIGGTSADLGSITVYYCTAQTSTPASSSSCASFAITSTSGGSITPTSTSLPATNGVGYFEVVAYAASGATVSTAVTFQVTVSWT